MMKNSIIALFVCKVIIYVEKLIQEQRKHGSELLTKVLMNYKVLYSGPFDIEKVHKLETDPLPTVK